MKYELPAFQIPKQGMHWAMKALCVVGGLVVVQMVLVGVFVWKRHSAQAAQELAVAAAQEARVVAPAAELKTAPVAAERPSDVAASPAPALVQPAPVVASTRNTPARRATVHASTRSSSKSSKAGRTGSDRRLLAAVHGKVGSKSAGSSRKPDAIDELLRSFK